MAYRENLPFFEPSGVVISKNSFRQAVASHAKTFGSQVTIKTAKGKNVRAEATLYGHYLSLVSD